jgi:hypothetical protein
MRRWLTLLASAAAATSHALIDAHDPARFTLTIRTSAQVHPAAPPAPAVSASGAVTGSLRGLAFEMIENSE